MVKRIDILDDDGKLKMRYTNKRVNAEKEGIPFKLTPSEFMQLMVDAKVVSSQLGIKGYHLARKGDKGPYSYKNARFLWYVENYAERKVSEKSRLASARNIQGAVRPPLTPEQLQAAGKAGALARGKSLAEEMRVKDAWIMKRVAKRSVIKTGWGWKTRLSEELNISTRELAGFLKRNPSYQ